MNKTHYNFRGPILRLRIGPRKLGPKPTVVSKRSNRSRYKDNPQHKVEGVLHGFWWKLMLLDPIAAEHTTELIEQH